MALKWSPHPRLSTRLSNARLFINLSLSLIHLNLTVFLFSLDQLLVSLVVMKFGSVMLNLQLQAALVSAIVPATLHFPVFLPRTLSTMEMHVSRRTLIKGNLVGPRESPSLRPRSTAKFVLVPLTSSQLPWCFPWCFSFRHLFPSVPSKIAGHDDF